MAEVQPAGAPADNPGGGDSQFGFGKMMQMVSRAVLTYYAIQMVTSTFKTKPANTGQSTPAGVPEIPQQRAPPGLVRDNMFSKGELLDMWLYSSTGPSFIEGDPDLKLLWHEKDVRLCDEDPRRLSLQYPLTPVLKNNGTAHLHVFFARSGMKHLPSDTGYVPEAVFSSSHPLVKYVQLPKQKTRGSNLLAGSSSIGINEGQNDTAVEPDEEVDGDASEEEQQQQQLAGEIVAHWKPNITIALVQDFTSYPDAQIPPQIREHLVIDPYSGNYYPPVFFNDFWLLKEHLVPLNSTIDVVDLHLELTYTHVFMWQILIGTEMNFAMQREFGAMGENEADQIKRIFIEGNPYFLGLTMVVSLFHTVFDMLAFKSDIGFWRNNKSMEGLSARSIIIQAFCQIVIFLYLLDNDTSYVVLFSNGMGLVIQFWKITKVMDVTVVSWNGLPALRFEDRASYSQNKTKQYDAEATKYLSYVLFPLVLIYSVYALIYQTHKSWYSWVVNSLVGAVYMFGFILMCPQLYLNYKLKSVAHMPWRQMTYKFLNTIIDDLFAFVIKMPLLHRLSVFRDDLIFVIFLYQRWIYRVDMTRTNEFGFSAEEPDEAEKPAIEGGDGDAAAAAAAEEQGEEQDGTNADEATSASGKLTRRKGKSNKKAKASAAAEGSIARPDTTDKKAA